MRQECDLILSDGSCFNGQMIGAPLRASGEMVFTTGMVGYSEAITDPSYFGQILCFTYPLVGNYGIPDFPKGSSESLLPLGFESSKPHTAAVVISIDSPEVFHWNSFQCLDRWLKRYNVPGIIGVDTRHLVQKIRSNRNLLGRIEPEFAEGVRTLGTMDTASSNLAFFDPGMHEIIPEVSTSERRLLGKGSKRIGLIDCGVKWNIIRQIISYGFEIELLPWDTDLSTCDCDAWLISNGPGDPSRSGFLPERVKTLLVDNRPILGICLGHQILALAAGARTRRMNYGHRSHNQPVYLVGSRKGYMTSQNHGYVIDEATLPENWDIWFRNINDDSIEGIRHKDKPFFSVQFHPEASGGPCDTAWIFEKVLSEVK